MTSRRSSRGGTLKPGTAQITPDGMLRLNLQGIEAGGRRRKNIPMGDYAAKVRSAKSTKFKTGSQGLVVIFELTDGQYRGTPFWENVPLINPDGTTMDNVLWKVRGILEALGVSVPESAFNINPMKLVGRSCGLGIVDGTDGDGNVRSEINDIFPLSQMAEEEEAEEEEDEEPEEEEEEELEEEDEYEDEEDIDLS